MPLQPDAQGLREKHVGRQMMALGPECIREAGVQGVKRHVLAISFDVRQVARLLRRWVLLVDIYIK